jgi:hypothetical protein
MILRRPAQGTPRDALPRSASTPTYRVARRGDRDQRKDHACQGPAHTPRWRGSVACDGTPTRRGRERLVHGTSARVRHGASRTAAWGAPEAPPRPSARGAGHEVAAAVVAGRGRGRRRLVFGAPGKRSDRGKWVDSDRGSCGPDSSELAAAMARRRCRSRVLRDLQRLVDPMQVRWPSHDWPRQLAPHGASINRLWYSWSWYAPRSRRWQPSAGFHDAARLGGCARCLRPLPSVHSATPRSVPTGRRRSGAAMRLAAGFPVPGGGQWEALGDFAEVVEAETACQPVGIRAPGRRASAPPRAAPAICSQASRAPRWSSCSLRRS